MSSIREKVKVGEQSIALIVNTKTGKRKYVDSNKKSLFKRVFG